MVFRPLRDRKGYNKHMQPSLAQRILDSKKPFVLYHTHSATEESIRQAIRENKSMDLDISVDREGKPYLGHTEEYYEISGETQSDSMPLNKAINLIARANIPVIVDCKHHDAWSTIKDIVNKIGAHRCLVNFFVSELKFTHNLSHDHDYPINWFPVSKLRYLKNQFPNVTTTASCIFSPSNLLISNQYLGLLKKIRKIIIKNHLDAISLNLPDETISDKILKKILSKNIIPHVRIDNIDVSTLSSVYIGETDILENAFNCKILNY